MTREELHRTLQVTRSTVKRQSLLRELYKRDRASAEQTAASAKNVRRN
ncbi:MAG: hypothetical protein QGG36_07780 [Pirellulaceae bacterium]|jgi:hypothetical protein|nr:hypothetical protein [Pirellulaceae bacterium]MDP7015684.1 hypothetical protein [Pirellulaceae bacterium]